MAKKKAKSKPKKVNSAKKMRPATIVNKKGKTVKNKRKNRKKAQVY